ncbi:hypothetical protein LCGC14_1878570 [marine sediment metagenome]|uniref:Uncharacterized protein n=1 Tax=marine sediment metagenome TaxID=412755 RepID=A0A0F9GR16_9ZZZZ
MKDKKPKTKICNKCKKRKSFNKKHFISDKSRKYGLSYKCKICCRKSAQDWDNNNKEKRKEHNKNWRKENKDKVKKSHKKWCGKK